MISVELGVPARGVLLVLSRMAYGPLARSDPHAGRDGPCVWLRGV